MRVLSYRAFSTEFLKIAADIGDADVRALLADRRGEEYLKGGELQTNQVVPAGDGAAVKISSNNMMMIAPGLLRAHKREDSPYQTIRDTGIKAQGGAAAGAGSLSLMKNMQGKTMTPNNYRAGALVGAGLALADKAYRHRQEIESTVRRKPKAKTKLALVQQNTGAAFRSPADALASTSNVGKFQNVVHQSAAKVPGLLGKAFRLHT